jgi:hypothetical protein
MAPKKQERSDAPKLPPLWERLQGQIDWYDRKASVNQHAYKASKIAIIVCAVIIPIVAEYSLLAVGIAARRDPAARRAAAGQQMAGELDPLPLDLRGLAQRAASLQREVRSQAHAGGGA